MKSKIKEIFKDIPTWLTITATLALNNLYGIGITKTVGPSMLPTINGEFLVVDNFSYSILNKELHKGDIVICRSPTDKFKLVCKRVAGLEGDLVQRDIGGIPIPELVPPGHVWLLGDNPSASLDSRSYGPVPRSNIRGKVFFNINAWQKIE